MVQASGVACGMLVAMRRFTSTLLLVATLGCGVPASPDVVPSHGTSSPPATTSADGILRAVDWCNRAYADGQPRLIACRGETEQRHQAGAAMWGTLAYHLQSVTYGDLTGDGHEDALLMLEQVTRPLLRGGSPPQPTWVAWIIERRGDDLFQYTTESLVDEPVSVTIAAGVVRLTARRGSQTCDEEWRFKGEGQAATKTAGACRAT